MTKPVLLLDDPDEEVCDELGWVETTVSEDEARDALVEFVFDEDGRPARPIGAAKRVRLVPGDGDYAIGALWVPARPDDPNALEFYEFDVQNCEAI